MSSPSDKQPTYDLAFLRQHVPEFEGYIDEEARHHSDQRVRAWVGSMLAGVQSRLNGTLPPDVEQALEAAIFRCQFPDQVFTTRLDVAEMDANLEETLAKDDRRLVELADRAKTATPEQLPAILSDLSAAFDRRRQSVPIKPTIG